MTPTQELEKVLGDAAARTEEAQTAEREAILAARRISDGWPAINDAFLDKRSVAVARLIAGDSIDGPEWAALATLGTHREVYRAALTELHEQLVPKARLATLRARADELFAEAAWLRAVAAEQKSEADAALAGIRSKLGANAVLEISQSKYLETLQRADAAQNAGFRTSVEADSLEAKLADLAARVVR